MFGIDKKVEKMRNDLRDEFIMLLKLSDTPSVNEFKHVNKYIADLKAQYDSGIKDLQKENERLYNEIKSLRYEIDSPRKYILGQVHKKYGTCIKIEISNDVGKNSFLRVLINDGSLPKFRNYTFQNKEGVKTVLTEK